MPTKQGDPAEPGQTHGSKVKLVVSGSGANLGCNVYLSCFLGKSTKFLSAGDCGVLSHHSLFQSQKFFPRQFRITDRSCTLVTCLDGRESYFLAGYEDGIVALYTTTSSHSIKSWNLGQSVVQIHWSPQRPVVFFALDCNGTVFVWNLSDQLHEPIYEFKPLPNVSVFGFHGQKFVCGDASGRLSYCDLDTSLIEPLEDEGIELQSILLQFIS